MENKDYVLNGVIYNLGNIWEYMRKDYWDVDELKFDFWYRLNRHQQIFNEVMKINGINMKNNENCEDNTKKLLDEMKELNKDYKIEITWDD